MKLIPAIDLKDNKCVRLSEGKEATSVIYNEDPVQQSIFFEKEGCKRIHIVDLDAAFGREKINKDTILKIRDSVSIKIQLGGGIRSEEDVGFWIREGIDFLIVGSLAIKNPKTTKKIIKVNPNKIYIALDDLNGKPLIHGWIDKVLQNTADVVYNYNQTDICGFVFTDISRDGMMNGIDIKKVSEHLSKSKKPIIVGGGLSNYDDLVNLSKLNTKILEGVIAGRSFYLGNIEIKIGQKILDNNA